MKITNAWICSINDDKIEPVFGDININNGKISGIDKKPFEYHKVFNETIQEKDINAKGCVVTIPNINFHDHFYSRLAKGLPITGPMDNFQNILKSLWWKVDTSLDREMIIASAQLGILDSIKNGVTYIFDHHSSPQTTSGSLQAIADVFDDLGTRGVICFETTDRNGHQLAEEGINENKNFLGNYVNDNVKGLLGLHASFTVSDETLQMASRVVEENDLGIHIHLCEDKIDREQSEKQFDLLPVERLKKFKLLNKKSILSHGIHLTKSDYNTIAKYGCAIAFNPDSNMNNAVGLPDFNIIPDEIPVLMGTDGMNSNPSRSLKQLFLLLRHSGKSFEESFTKIQNIYFNQLKFVKRFFPDFTGLNTGDRADLIIWDYVPPTPFSIENFWGHFLYGIIESRIKDVLHNGIILLKDFELKFNDDIYTSNIVKEGHRFFNKFGESSLHTE
ncbi:MAG: amidohydrolase family protein [Bacteroidetes bacterium]|nr:amidohydrolase family protein [Bacteroidota bacterium]